MKFKSPWGEIQLLVMKIYGRLNEKLVGCEREKKKE